MALLSLGVVCLLLSFLAAAAEPDVPVINMTVKEDSDIVLNCLFTENIKLKIFEWRTDNDKEVFRYDPISTTCPNDIFRGCPRKQLPQFEGRVLYFNDRLDSGNASITIHRATLKERGNYTCYIQSQGDALTPISRISLTVSRILKDRTNEKVNGKCPTLSIEVIYRPGKANLRCEFKGAFPKPTIEWQDDNGSRVSDEVPEFKPNEGGIFDGILETSVIQNGTYYCVVTQEVIHHQTKREKTVGIPDQGSSSDLPCNQSQVITVLSVALSIFVPLGILGLFFLCKKMRNSSMSTNVGTETKSMI